MRSFLFPFMFFFLTALVCKGQGELNHWVFGVNAGIDFINGNPTPVFNPNINHMEGVAIASKPAGGLLFYTNGLRVWNRNHALMPNGSGLNGGLSASDVLIVQQPGTCNYFIFHVDDENGTAKLWYSVVDMSLNGGLGDVILTQKNIVLHNATSEHLCALPQANNQSWWIISHSLPASDFRVFQLTQTGINMTPIIST